MHATSFVPSLGTRLHTTTSPVAGISLLLRVQGEGVEPHGGVVVGQHPQVEVIELERQRKLTHHLVGGAISTVCKH